MKHISSLHDDEKSLRGLHGLCCDRLKEMRICTSKLFRKLKSEELQTTPNKNASKPKPKQNVFGIDLKDLLPSAVIIDPLLTAECIWFKCDLYLRFIPPINIWNIWNDLRPFLKCKEGPFSRSWRSLRSNSLEIQNDKNSKSKLAKTRWNPKFGLGDLQNDLLTSTTSEMAEWFFLKKFTGSLSKIVEIKRSFSRSLRPNFGFRLILTSFHLEFSSFWILRLFDLSDLHDLKNGPSLHIKNGLKSMQIFKILMAGVNRR